MSVTQITTDSVISKRVIGNAVDGTLTHCSGVVCDHSDGDGKVIPGLN
jgi:hypothetical protein